MADDAGDKIEVKTLKNTNLKPDDLSKAIEASTKSLSKTKPAKTETPAKSLKSAKTEKTEPAKVKAESIDKSEGSQVIVKKKTAYVSGAYSAPPPKSEPAPAPESKVELKPPSALGKPVVVPSSTAQPAPPAPTPAPSPAIASPAATTAAPPSPAASPQKPPNTMPTHDSKTTAEPAQQALKTFDTTQYHLPIKPTAGNHYMNKFLSWTILILVFVLVGGYVLWQLEVIDLSSFGF